MRKRGRKPVSEDGSTRVSIRLPNTVYDRLDAAAKREDISVPERIRQLLQRNFGAVNSQRPLSP